MTFKTNQLSKTLRRTALAAALIAACGASAPVTASAAGGSAPDLRVCMKYGNGAAYASKPIYLYVHNGSSWVHTRSGSTNASGCATWVDVTANRYYYVQGYWTYAVGSAGYYYNGNTGSGLVGGVRDGLYSLATGYVNGPYRLY